MVKRALTILVAVLLLSGQGSIARAGNNVDGEEIRALDRAHNTFGYSGAPQGDREAGAYPVVFTNTSTKGPHEIVFLRIAAANQRATKKQIMTALDKNDFSFFDYFAGAAFSQPGETTTSVGGDGSPGPVQLRPGRYVYVCFEPWPNGTPHYQLGMFGTFKAR